MLEMESLEVDKNDYPTYPPTIYKTEVKKLIYFIHL